MIASIHLWHVSKYQLNQVILNSLFTRFSYQVFLQEMRSLSLLYWLEKFYVPIGITKLLSLWGCFCFSLVFFWCVYITISLLICQCFFAYFFIYFCFILLLYVVFLYFLLIIVIIQNICLYNKKGSFLQKSKWVFKKGFLQDVRHNLWEILSGWGRRSRLRQPNSGETYRKVGRTDCGNDFSDALQYSEN